MVPEEMAACDRAAIAAGTPGVVLMERAGAAVAQAARRMMGGTYGRRVEILCGKGSNGGDGLVAARHLLAMGAAPRLALPEEGCDLAGDAAEHWRRLSGLHIAVRPAPYLADADLVVDALFGTGLSGPLREPAAGWVEEVNRAGRQVLAVDIPSGVKGGTGEVEGAAVRADCTLTMAALKVGLVRGRGAELSGRVEVADIGIEVPLASASWACLDEADVAAWRPRRRHDTHKWDVGSVLVVAASPGMTGAGVLTASAALRAGAGLVVLAVPGLVRPGLEGHPDLTEIMTASHEEVFDLLPRFSAVALGPGLRVGERQGRLVEQILAEAEVPVVLDADGINNTTTASVTARAAPTILTPHAGELARLLGGAVEDPVESVPKLAAQWGCVLLLKGSTTTIASAEGQRVLNLTGRPELATAGTGDVLTGVIAALAAQGLEPWKAAALGAHLHGLAGRGVTRAGEVRDRIR